MTRYFLELYLYKTSPQALRTLQSSRECKTDSWFHPSPFPTKSQLIQFFKGHALANTPKWWPPLGWPYSAGRFWRFWTWSPGQRCCCNSAENCSSASRLDSWRGLFYWPLEPKVTVRDDWNSPRQNTCFHTAGTTSFEVVESCRCRVLKNLQ